MRAVATATAATCFRRLRAGRLYLSVLCRCYGNRCQGDGVVGGNEAVTNAAVTRHRGARQAAAAVDVDDDDDDAATFRRRRDFASRSPFTLQ